MLRSAAAKPLVMLVPDAIDWVLGTWAREIAAYNAADYDFAIVPLGEISGSPERFSRILDRTDVVHCLTQSGFAAVSAAVRAHGRPDLPVVASIHHIVDPDDVGAAGGAPGIAVMCDEVREALCARGVPAERIRLLRYRIDPEFFAPGDRAAARERLGLAGDAFTIGFAGKAASNDRGRKGVDVLISAIEKLAAPGNPPLRVVFTGPGWNGSLAKKLPRNVAVEVFSFLPRERMCDFYRALDAYVCTARVEGGPVPVLEAMSCGTPVVSTPVGSVRDIARDGVEALLVPIGDACSAAEAISSLRSDPELAHRLGRAGRARILETVGGRDVLRGARELYAPFCAQPVRAAAGGMSAAAITQANEDFAASDSMRWRARLASRSEAYGEVAHIDLDTLGVAASSRILDLGCGNGQFTLPLLGRKLAVTSMDLDAPRLREVRESCLEAELEGRIVRANGAHLPCPSESLDVVVCREMIEHIHKPGAVLDEIHRVLRPEGRLCVTVPSAHTERYFQWVDPRWLAMAGHVHVFTRAAMCDLLVRHGFEVTEIRGRNFFYSFFWFVHTLVRTTHDGTGRIQDHFALARRVKRFWRMLGEGRLKRGIERIGNAAFPKSNVYYCVKSRRE